jgi:hypothetical protein
VYGRREGERTNPQMWAFSPLSLDSPRPGRELPLLVAVSPRAACPCPCRGSSFVQPSLASSVVLMMHLFDVVSHRLEQYNGVRRWYIEGAADSEQAGCW